jgi:hypothetical protein
LEKIYTISTLLAVLLAIVSAFVSVPMSAAALLVLGGIGALNNSNHPDLRLRIYAAAILLILGAKSLTAIPVVGDPLAAIFSGIATAFIGASVVGITLAVIQLITSNLSKQSK